MKDDNHPASEFDDEARLLLSMGDWAMIGAWKAQNPHVLTLAKLIIANEKANAPPPPPMNLDAVTALQVSIFDNWKPGGDKKVRFAASVKAWDGDETMIRFSTTTPRWAFSGDLLDAKGLKAKAKALQKTTGYGKVTRPISDGYREYLEELADTLPDHHFVPLMATGKGFGRYFPEGEVLSLRFEKNGRDSTAAEARVWSGREGMLDLPPFVTTSAAKRGVAGPLKDNAILQSRYAPRLPNWTTEPPLPPPAS